MKTSGTETRSGVSDEIVLYQGEAAKKSHRNLFTLDAACYRNAGNDMVRTILSVDLKVVCRLHIAAGWETTVGIALWTSGTPPVHDVLALLRKAGVTDEELLPFVEADVRDFFPWLYYGNRSDVLRKICNIAKAKVEEKLAKKKLFVYCHLVSDEEEKIIASNL